MTLENPDIVARAFAAAMVAENFMLRTGTRQTTRLCVSCGGQITFALAGRNDHLRASCANPDCTLEMIE